MTEPRPIGTIWIHSQHACSGCGREHQALCQMTDGTHLCVSCQYAPGETNTDLPEGWQYGVVTTDGRVWGCGDGADGQARQRMRLRYANTKGPCMLPLHVVSVVDDDDVPWAQRCNCDRPEKHMTGCPKFAGWGPVSAYKIRGAYRVHWLHPTSTDRMVGDEWDKETAEHIAHTLRRAGCREVEVRRWDASDV